MAIIMSLSALFWAFLLAYSYKAGFAARFTDSTKAYYLALSGIDYMKRTQNGLPTIEPAPLDYIDSSIGEVVVGQEIVGESITITSTATVNEKSRTLVCEICYNNDMVKIFENNIRSFPKYGCFEENFPVFKHEQN